MTQLSKWVLTLWSLSATLGIGAAQDNTVPPPKVAVIYREFLKPGKAGMTHEKTEVAFVQAYARAKWPTHYFALDSVSGKPRSLFILPYDSFDAWEKDNKAQQGNASLQTALTRANLADGDVQSDADAGIFTYNEELSLRGPVDIAHMRYMEITQFQLRPGHHKDWEDLVKLVIAAYQKVTGAHWATYERAFGNGSSYLVFTPLKTAAEIDQQSDEDKQFMSAMGEDGMKKLYELEGAAIEWRQDNLFTFNPRTSYPPDAWVKADPEFWKAKAMSAPPHKKSTDELQPNN